jgi:prophage regulatory protein
MPKGNNMSIIRRPAVSRLTGLSTTTIYARLNPKSKSYDPTFPRQLKLGEGKNPPVGWILEEVESWETARKAARDTEFR